MRRAATMIALALTGTAGAAALRTDWRQVATVEDRGRLRDWRDAWMAGLADARGGDGAAAIATDPALFAPDGALVDGAMPPPGEYRCRRVRLGARRGAPALAIEAWGRCRIEGTASPRQLAGEDGVQRPAGLIYADRDARAVFLGTALFPDERRPATYGHTAGRDMAGLVERIGERRWRLVLPFPHFGGVLDLLELEPA